MQKVLLLVAALVTLGGLIPARAQIGWRLPQVEQYFGERGERKGLFEGRTVYSFHTPAYDVRVGFDADGTVGFIGWMKTEEDDGNNTDAKFTEAEVQRLLRFASNVEWKRGPDTFGNNDDLFGATWIGYFRGKPTFKAEIQNGAHGDVYEELRIDTFR